MLSADQSLWHTQKSRRRMAIRSDIQPAVAVQLAGSDPAQLAAAAQQQVDAGADIIDLNLGCPAKKVCNRLCGSALLGDDSMWRKLPGDLLRWRLALVCGFRNAEGWRQTDLRSSRRSLRAACHCSGTGVYLSLA